MKKRMFIMASVAALSIISGTVYAANNGAEKGFPKVASREDTLLAQQPDPFQSNADIQSLKSQVKQLQEQNKLVKGQLKEKRQKVRTLRTDLKSQFAAYKTATENKDATAAKDALTKIITIKKQILEMNQKINNAL